MDILQKKKDKYRTNRVNPLYLLVHEIDGFIEEKEGSKYLNITLTDSNSRVLKKYADIWSGIKDQIEQINGSKSGDIGVDIGTILIFSSIYLAFFYFQMKPQLLIVINIEQ